jgi:cellulose synthase/poly-beta-1,6-N-acetylglucosamine synthase-like glycosyltransferase
MSTVFFWFLLVFNVVAVAYFILLNSSYLITTFLAFHALRRYKKRLRTVDVEDLISRGGVPPITLIAPAYNEEATCVESVRALLTLRYPDYEVVVVNDGSKDATLQQLVTAYEMEEAVRLPTAQLPTARVRAIYHSRRHANLWLIDKDNGGKADALNTGVNYCRSPYFCGMDADTLLERDALIRVIRPFLEDDATIAAGGIIRIVNGCRVEHGSVTDVRMPDSWLARFQVIEYLRAFLGGRMGWDALDAMLIISGAFGIFKRAIVVDVGGYWPDTVGEDMELVVRLHRHCREHDIRYKVAFVPDPVAWTECPESLLILGRQRDRWQRGLYQTLTRHRVMLFNRRYGRVGLVAFPYFYFLELFGPAVELIGYVTFAIALVTGHIDALFATAFLMVAFAFGLALSVIAVGLEELTFGRYSRFSDLLRLLLVAVVENFGYRQINAYWRIRGLLSAKRQNKGWGAMVRKGFQPPPIVKG